MNWPRLGQETHPNALAQREFRMMRSLSYLVASAPLFLNPIASPYSPQLLWVLHTCSFVNHPLLTKKKKWVVDSWSLNHAGSPALHPSGKGRTFPLHMTILFLRFPAGLLQMFWPISFKYNPPPLFFIKKYIKPGKKRKCGILHCCIADCQNN